MVNSISLFLYKERFHFVLNEINYFVLAEASTDEA